MQMVGPFIGLFLTAVGVFIILAPIISAKKKSKICTEKVEAVISALSHRYTKGKHSRVKVYAPIYDYQYNGINYQYGSDFYSNAGVKPVGTRLDIYINPLNPEEVYVKHISGIVTSIIVGLFILWMGLTIFSISFVTYSPT